jgi:hypothetical protein
MIMMTEQEKWEFNYKDEIIRDLQAALRGEIREVGTYQGTSWNINYSSILTKLIKEASRWCEHYASDLFILWQWIERCLEAGYFPVAGNNEYVFAFKKSGVDDRTGYEYHKENKDYYRAVWFLKITTDINKGEIEMHLHK